MPKIFRLPRLCAVQENLYDCFVWQCSHLPCLDKIWPFMHDVSLSAATQKGQWEWLQNWRGQEEGRIWRLLQLIGQELVGSTSTKPVALHLAKTVLLASWWAVALSIRINFIVDIVAVNFFDCGRGRSIALVLFVSVCLFVHTYTQCAPPLSEVSLWRCYT